MVLAGVAEKHLLAALYKDNETQKTLRELSQPRVKALPVTSCSCFKARYHVTNKSVVTSEPSPIKLSERLWQATQLRLRQ